MADLLFPCPGCSTMLDIEENASGETIECPACQVEMTVPVPEIEWDCLACSETLCGPEGLKGQSIECPSCGKTKPIPDAGVRNRNKLHLKNSRRKSVSEKTCPGCGAMMRSTAVLCVSCGMDLRTGKVISTRTEHRQLTSETKQVITFLTVVLVLGLLTGAAFLLIISGDGVLPENRPNALPADTTGDPEANPLHATDELRAPGDNTPPSLDNHADITAVEENADDGKEQQWRQQMAEQRKVATAFAYFTEERLKTIAKDSDLCGVAKTIVRYRLKYPTKKECAEIAETAEQLAGECEDTELALALAGTASAMRQDVEKYDSGLLRYGQDWKTPNEYQDTLERQARRKQEVELDLKRSRLEQVENRLKLEKAAKARERYQSAVAGIDGRNTSRLWSSDTREVIRIGGETSSNADAYRKHVSNTKRLEDAKRRLEREIKEAQQTQGGRNEADRIGATGAFQVPRSSHSLAKMEFEYLVGHAAGLFRAARELHAGIKAKQRDAKFAPTYTQRHKAFGLSVQGLQAAGHAMNELNASETEILRRIRSSPELREKILILAFSEAADPHVRAYCLGLAGDWQLLPAQQSTRGRTHTPIRPPTPIGNQETSNDYLLSHYGAYDGVYDDVKTAANRAKALQYLAGAHLDAIGEAMANASGGGSYVGGQAGRWTFEYDEHVRGFVVFKTMR